MIAFHCAGALYRSTTEISPPTDDPMCRMVLAAEWPTSPTNPMVQKAFPTMTGVVLPKEGEPGLFWRSSVPPPPDEGEGVAVLLSR